LLCYQHFVRWESVPSFFKFQLSFSVKRGMKNMKKIILSFIAAITLQAGAVEVQTAEFPAARRVDSAQEPERIQGFLSKPTGAGPFGAVVALHGCGGLSARFKQEMTDRYTAWGYVVLVVDSFAHHPVKFACGSDRARSRADERPADALGAVQFLASLPDVDPSRIALIGSSQGSWVALDAVQSRPRPYYHQVPVRPRAVVAYYPDCRASFDTFDVPILILVGGLDDWTPADRCQQMVNRRAGRGAPVDLIVYPEARHAFDWVDLQPARRVAGYLMEYHEPSARDSMQKHREFLERHIGGRSR
jgi:dienelactone hydrolase